MKHADFIARGRELFGPSPINWQFKCPSCGDVASGIDFRDALATSPRRRTDGSDAMASDFLGQVCIGRLLGALRKSDKPYTGRGCDWSANGLFRGPIHVEGDNGQEMWCFEFADVEHGS